ncbi:NHL repeat-containing protein 2 [Arthrobacter sp. Hiyo8]|nr:NHL repeat-containing protein 2 [Arthrobacter sp. Hiyo8]
MSETVRTQLRVRASELVGRGWLNTGGKTLDLEALRGKIVLLDFWTFCCINCLHVLDELRPLEEKYSDILVTVGVHSPKFEHEADPVALASAVERYEIHHPVLDDPELATWKAYTARAWPTLVVVDPEGYIVAHLSGEGHADGLAVLLEELVAEHEAKGTLHRGDGPYVAPVPTSAPCASPARRPSWTTATTWWSIPATTVWWNFVLTLRRLSVSSAPEPRVTWMVRRKSRSSTSRRAWRCSRRRWLGSLATKQWSRTP